MGQQMINKFKEYGDSGTALSTEDKQHPFLVKTVPLRQLPNEAQNIINRSPAMSPLSKDRGHIANTNETRSIMPSGSSALSRDGDPAADADGTRNITAKTLGSLPLSAERGPTTNAVKFSGSKRQQPDSSSSPPIIQSSGNYGANGHLVYVRRKLETEPGKLSTYENTDVNFTGLKNYNNGGIKDLKAQQQPIVEPHTTLSVSAANPVSYQANPYEGFLLPGFDGKLTAGLSATEPSPMITSKILVQGDPQNSRSLDWKERFLRLQIFLKNCDQSSQEDYIQKLRSLSPTGRSKHAVELEKRAIQLLLEEGKELNRMKILNVLGKVLPKDNTSPLTQTTYHLQSPFQRNGKPSDAVKFPFLRNQ